VHRFLRTLIFSVWAVSTSAQQFSFINYSVENGLASSQVTDIAQDHLGYLWVGTQSGLSRFDGLEFKTFSSDDGLPDNKIERLYFDQEGTFWVATPRGVGRFENTGFKPFYFPAGHNIETRINHLTTFRNELYVASDSGLIVLRNEKFEYLQPADSVQPKLRALVNYNDEMLICGSSTGLYVWNDEMFERFTHVVSDSINISDIDLVNDCLYASSFGDGILMYDLTDNNTGFYDDIKSVRSVFVDSLGVIGASRRGAIEYSQGKSESYSDENGLLNPNLRCVFRDSEGNLWMGSDGNGLIKFLGKSVTSYTTQDGLSSNLIMSICETGGGNTIVLGSYDGGLTTISGDSISPYFLKSVELKSEQVWCLVSDKAGGFYAGTTDGVSCYSPHGIRQGGVCEISEKTRTILPIGEHWIASGGSGGLKIFKDAELMRNESGMDVNDIESIENSLYIATGNGLYSLSLFESESPMKKIPLQNENIQTICSDKSGRLWVGTIGGLFVIDGEKIIPVVPDAAEFRSRNIVGLLCDKSGDIWASTYNGVYLLHVLSGEKPRMTVMHYGLEEGIVHLECNQNALFEDSKGLIWVGTSGGLSVIDPSKNDQLFSYDSPKLHIRNVRLFIEDFEFETFGSDIDPETGMPRSFELPYNKNHLTFDFIGVHLKNPSGVQYKYRLKGMDEEWSPVSNSRYATFSNISPGDYTFEVIAANRNFEWSAVQSIQVTILPPFWGTWWFSLLAALTVLSIIVLIFQVRIRTIKQKQENEKLNFKNRLLFLEQRSLDASMNRHFIFNSLNSIQYFINSSDKKSANKYLSSFAKLIRKNLDSSASNNFVVTLQEEIERIELYLSLEKMRFQDKFEYQLIVSDDLETEEIEIPSMMIQPFVENSIIHGILPLNRMGKITLRIHEKPGQLILEVEDDGVGIDHSLGQKQAQMQGDHESKGMEITGKRLELLRKLSGESLSIDGPRQINDPDGRCLGTKVVIYIGLNSNSKENPTI